MNHLRSSFVLIPLCLGGLLTGCGVSDDQESAGTDPTTALAAETASFDLAAGVEQRYLLGLFSTDGGSIVDGSISLDFTYLGADATTAAALTDIDAAFVPVAGSENRPMTTTPHLAKSGEGTGAYEVRTIRFDRPGNWQVTATVQLDGTTQTVDDAFEVQPEQIIPAPGEPAPRSENRLAGDTEAPATAIDSRADGGTVPDPELHATTISQAVTTGRPTMVVVSTPTYCVSRFCGPITETVQQLAADYQGKANFVHLEVWNDYEDQAVNKSAAEWILPNGVDGGGGNEPWVFLIGADGNITQRWDNVTNADLLSAALDAQTTPT